MQGPLVTGHCKDIQIDHAKAQHQQDKKRAWDYIFKTCCLQTCSSSLEAYNTKNAASGNNGNSSEWKSAECADGLYFFYENFFFIQVDGI